VQAQDQGFQTAVATLALTGRLVDHAIDRIPSNEWLGRPAPKSNHVLWIVGHLATTRGLLVCTLEREREIPDDPLYPLFAGGTPLREDEAYPSASVVADAWREMATRVDHTLRNTTCRDLDRPSPEGVPTLNGLVSGVLAASVFHEAYHVGQLGYLMRWLGHGALLGR
jgi:hypothetical protein